MAGILLARSVGSTKTGVYSSPKGRSVKILIVDDDDDLVAFLAKELEARGCEIL
jgi:hypothetical protein